MMHKTTFSGPEALRDYLNPYHCVSPMVEIPQVLNPFYPSGVRIHLKMMCSTPLANVKSLPAWSMLQHAHDTSELGGVTTLIENSSGNTVFSLGILGKLFGIEKTQAIASHEISPGKLKLLRFFGIQPYINKEPICPDPSDPTSGIYLAKKMGG